MNQWISLIMAVFLSLTISGCDANSPKDINNQTGVGNKENATEVNISKTHVNETQSLKIAFSMASLPLIQNAVISLSPTFNGKRHDIIMAQVCALAEGVKTHDEFIQFFLNKGINLDKLAAQDPGFALLADNDLAKKKTACMAYNVSSAFIAFNARTSFQAQPGGDLNDALLAATSTSLNEIKLSQQLNDRLQVMISNAQFFSIIAENIEKHPIANITDYQKEVVNIASELAPVYLKLLQQNAKSHGPYTVLKMKDGDLVFSSANGYLYSLENNSAILRLQDINWYAEGELLGMHHFIKVMP